MILDFVKFLSNKGIEYRVTNGYREVFDEKLDDSDHDILFKKSDFSRIDRTIRDFCDEYNFAKVQVYHQSVWAKNYFIYDIAHNKLLNLDLYGEISRRQVKILDEIDVFDVDCDYQQISILRPHHEFIQYFLKKLDKQQLSKEIFEYLLVLYSKETLKCNEILKRFFQVSSEDIITAFQSQNYGLLKNRTDYFLTEFSSLSKNVSVPLFKNVKRLAKRITKPTGIAIAFLGPDGSGKSTIIDKLKKQSLPYRTSTYFHLKPIYKNHADPEIVVSNPHELPLYPPSISYLKLLYFLIQYNFYWIKNIIPLRIRSSLIIFDRYYEDLLVDNKRYRYGGNVKIAIGMRKLMLKPEIYFVLTTDAKVIYERKKEVSFKELESQLVRYQNLSKHNQFYLIDVNKPPDDIVIEITKIMMRHMSCRYE